MTLTKAWTWVKRSIFVLAVGYAVSIKFVEWKWPKDGPGTHQDGSGTVVLQPVIPETIFGNPKEEAKKEDCVPVVHYVPVKSKDKPSDNIEIDGKLKLGTFEVDGSEDGYTLIPYLDPVTGKTTLSAEEIKKLFRFGGKTLIGGQIIQDSLLGRAFGVVARQELGRMGPVHLELEGELNFIQPSELQNDLGMELDSTQWRIRLLGLVKVH